MSTLTGLTKGITAMLLSGMLVIGSASGSAFASEMNDDSSRTSEVAVEEVSSEKVAEEAMDAASVEYYTVTLDANGGYFENEWDDVLEKQVESVKILNKNIPIGEAVVTFPVKEEENAVVTFMGWSLEREGEVVSQEYFPQENCVLYAVWNVDESAVESESSAENTVDEDAYYRDGESVNTDDQDTKSFDESSCQTEESETDITQDSGDIIHETGIEDVSEEIYSGLSATVQGAVEYDVELYNGEYGKLTLVSMTSEGVVFDYENTSSIDLSLYSQFLTVDGVQYDDGWIKDELYYGGIADDVSAGMRFRCNFHIPNNNVNASSVAGQIEVTNYPQGKVLGTIAFNVGLNGGEPFNQLDQGQELYNGEYGILTLTSVTDTGFNFTYKNTSSQDYAIYSEYLTVDGVQYDDGWLDDGTYYGGINDNVSSNMTYNCSFHIPNNNVKASSVAGQIEITNYPQGKVLGMIAFNVGLNGGRPFDQPAQGQGLYNGEFGVLTLTSVTDTGFNFTYKNTSSQVYSLYSEFLTVDGVQYDDGWTDDNNYLGGIRGDISPNMTYDCSFYIPNNNKEVSTIAGQIQVTNYPQGRVLGNIAFNTEIDLGLITIGTESINEAIVTISDQTYTGEALEPKVTVLLKGTQLIKGIDYTVVYRNNINAGTATVTITGKGNYTGTISKTFKINKATQNFAVKATSSTIDIGKTTKVTASGAKEVPKFTFISSNTKIATVSTNGTVTGKTAGTATITVKAAETANYNAASKSVKITVNKVLKKPGNCHFAKWNNKKFTSCQIAWNKVAGAEGYQTLLSWTDGSHASSTYMKSNVLYRNCTVHPQHVSQMKVRAYYTAGGKRVFGPWSNVEYITPSPTTLTAKNASVGSYLKMNVSWNIIYGCNGYNVFITTNPNGKWYWYQSTAQNATAKSSVITKCGGAKLKKNTRYYVRIVTRRKRNGVFCTVPMPSNNTYTGTFIIK